MKFSIFGIIINHYKTFYNYSSGRVSIIDLLFHILIPIGFSVLINNILGVVISQSLTNIIITSLSIFAGLLFNLLVLIYTLSASDNSKNANRIKLIQEINTNISYGIILSVLLILLLFVVSIFLDLNTTDKYLIVVFSITRILVWAGLVQFIFTLLMILKRVYIVLKTQTQ